MSGPVIRTLEDRDWPEIRDIYRAGIATKHATFEVDAPSDYAAWSGKRVPGFLFGAVDENDKVIGWAAISPTSDRCVYAGVAENIIYVSPTAQGQGVGRALLAHLIRVTEDAGYWTLQAGIFPENIGSIKLHEALGFREVGRRERLGQMDGVWRDVLMFERRSKRVGT